MSNASDKPTADAPLSPPPSSAARRRLGTFEGVFLPTLLTILGAVMYLRVGWMVGNAGLAGAIVIIAITYVITICTGLSVASLATNVRVGTGGAFSILSQSLGLEVGGSVSVPFYAALSISVAFYLFAFSEGWARLFPDHPVAVVVGVGFVLCFAIAMASITAATRVRYVILVLVVASLVSVFLGVADRFRQLETLQSPQIWGDFPEGSFWVVFAVFFPAATGLLTGVNLSGTLAVPRRSIPVGTLAAIGLSLVVYAALAVWASRVATPQELVTNLTITIDRAAFDLVVLAGLLAATFSAALNSMVGAPRVMQAIGTHGVLPRGSTLARETQAGVPRYATILTGGIALITIVFGLMFGGLNAIAPLMTMFFLIIYAALNGVVLLEQTLGLISFRPLLRVPRVVPLVGMVGSITAMFLISPVFGLIAVVVTLLFYIYLLRRNLHAPWGDVRSGLFVTVAEWAAKLAASMPTSQERAWRPSLLVPVESTEDLARAYGFIRALANPRGSVHILGVAALLAQDALAGIESIVDDFSRDRVFARFTLLHVHDPLLGIRTGIEVIQGSFFRPTVLFLTVTPDANEDDIDSIVDCAVSNNMGAALLAPHPDVDLAHVKAINVWIRDQSPEWEVGLRLSNLDLSLLLAYQLARNWDADLTLITVVPEEAARSGGEAHLEDLISLGRMPRGTGAIVEVGAFSDFLPSTGRADLNILGLHDTVDLEFVRSVVDATGAPCVFVRDSGHESALA